MFAQSHFIIGIFDLFMFFFKNLLPNIGLKERATKLEITTADAKVTAVWVNKTPVIPLMKIKGINTATKTTVVAIIVLLQHIVATVVLLQQ